MGKRRQKLALPLVFVLAAIPLVGLSYFVGLSYLAGAGKIVHGVEAGGVFLGGKTPGEAERILRERTTVPDEIRVGSEAEEISLSAREIDIDHDVEATVENAYAMGREGNPLKQVWVRARGMFSEVEVPMAVSYDQQRISSRMEEVRDLASESHPAKVSINGSGEVEVSAAREGYQVNVEATLRNVEHSIENLDGQARLAGHPIEAASISDGDIEAAEETARAATEAPAALSGGGQEWKLDPEQIARIIAFIPEGGELRLAIDREAMRSELGSLFSELNTEVRDADFEFADGEIRVVPFRIGYELDEQKMLEDLEAGLTEGRRDYELPVQETGQPGFTTAQAEEQRPTEKLGEYRTRHTTPGNYNAPRVENLRTASRALTGQTVAPGETFSANDVLAGLDYNAASVFRGGKVEKALGGGLCQIASTLYMAANHAGMEVVERHPHFAMLDYIRPGLDATVWFGAANGFSGQELDMRFKNTSDSHIYIRQYVSKDGYLYAEVWGKPTGKEVSMTSRPLWINEDSAKWATQKTVERDGQTLQEGRMYTSTYSSLIEENGETQPPTEVRIAANRP